jgi:hypothetical protein
MSRTITVNGLGISHKGSGGASTATMPDVCKTPTPGGPVPIPYPNVSMSSSLSDGTTTVKVDGNMAAIKGCQYSMSQGDEPGTVGGVKSSTFKKESTFITYSFDVKFDGKNVCRHTDKKFQNSKNTVDLAGDIDPLGAAKLLQDIANKCNCEDAAGDPYPPMPPMDCSSLGVAKHECCESKIQEHRNANRPNGKPAVEGEKGYRRPAPQGQGDGRRPEFDPSDPMGSAPSPVSIRPGRASLLGFAKKLMKDLPGLAWKQARKIAFGGKCFPDAAIMHPNGAKQFADFKFPCTADSKLKMSAAQKLSYDVLGFGTGFQGESLEIKPNQPC